MLGNGSKNALLLKVHKASYIGDYIGSYYRVYFGGYKEFRLWLMLHELGLMEISEGFSAWAYSETAFQDPSRKLSMRFWVIRSCQDERERPHFILVFRRRTSVSAVQLPKQ